MQEKFSPLERNPILVSTFCKTLDISAQIAPCHQPWLFIYAVIPWVGVALSNLVLTIDSFLGVQCQQRAGWGWGE